MRSFRNCFYKTGTSGLTSQRTRFLLGLYMLLDGVVSIFTLGMWNSDFWSAHFCRALRKDLEQRKRNRIARSITPDSGSGNSGSNPDSSTKKKS